MDQQRPEVRVYALRLLGSIALEGPDGPVSDRATQRRHLALLALLAAAGRDGWSRDKVSACLWPESPSDSAGHSLADTVYRLRKELGEDVIEGRLTTLRLNPAVVQADVVDFEQALEQGDLAGAVALYRGPFLDGFHLKDSSEFEHWKDAEAQRLERRLQTALETLAERATTQGSPAEAVGWLERLHARDLFNSRTVLRLMEAQAAAGDPANAVKLATEHEELLAGELGVELPAELRALQERLRAAEIPSALAVQAEVTGAESLLAPPLPGQPILAGGRRWLPGLAMVAVVAVAGALATLKWRGGGSTTHTAQSVAAVAQDDPRRIAVGPLQYRGKEEDAALWVELAAEAITREIQRAGLEVVTLPGGKGALGAAETEATHLLTGILTVLGDELRFDLQVSDRDRSLVRALDPIKGRADALQTTLDVVATRAAAAALAVTDNDYPLGAFESLPPTADVLHRVSAAGHLFTCEQDWVGAIGLLEPVLEEYPDHLPALMWIAPAYGNAGRGQEGAAARARLGALVGTMTPFERAWFDMWTGPTNGARVRAAKAAFAIEPRSQGYILAVHAFSSNRLDLALEGLDGFRPLPRCEWLPYWELRTAVHHLRGEFAGELRWARDGLASLENTSTPSRFRYMSLLMTAEARALAALDSVHAARSVVERMMRLPTPVANNIAELAADQHRHGRGAFGEELRGASMELLGRPQESGGTNGAYVLYQAGAWERLLPLAREMDDEPGEATAVQLRHLIAALEGTGHPKEADSAQARLTALYPRSQFRAGLPLMRGDVGGAVRVLMDVMVQGGSLYGSVNLWLHLGPWDPSIYDDPRFEAFLEDVATGEGG